MVIGIGEVLWDMFPDGKKIGGAPANFAYHVAQFGLDSRVVSAVGNDLPGEEILRDLKGKRLHSQISRVGFPTGTVFASVDGRGVPSYRITENVAWDNIPFSPALEKLARDTRLVCFGSLAQRCAVSRMTIARFLENMPEEEKQYKVFDVNLRQHFYTRHILYESMRRCNILKLNDEEAVLIGRMFGYPSENPEDCCRRLRKEYHLELLILTCGVKGSRVFTPEGISVLPTPQVQVVDTVGAGDSFTAAFCASLLKGRTVEEAHRLAVDVAAFVCTRAGAMPPLPQELKDRLK